MYLINTNKIFFNNWNMRKVHFHTLIQIFSIWIIVPYTHRSFTKSQKGLFINPTRVSCSTMKRGLLDFTSNWITGIWESLSWIIRTQLFKLVIITKVRYWKKKKWKILTQLARRKRKILTHHLYIGKGEKEKKIGKRRNKIKLRA